MKELIKVIYVKGARCELYRDSETGIAMLTDGSGLGYSCHPNIDETGNVEGMKARRYWDKDDVCLKSFGLIYNVSKLAIDPYDEKEVAVSLECMCPGCIRRRENAKKIWESLEDVPFDEDEEGQLILSEDFEISYGDKGFTVVKGSTREEVWATIEDITGVSVAWLMWHEDFGYEKTSPASPWHG